LLLWALPWSVLVAQEPPAPAAAPAIPRPDQLEPAVTTSPDSAPASPAPAAATADPAEGKASAKPAGKAAPASEAAAKSGARKAGADRVELGTTDITGNRELPKVLYIVPWKSSDLGDLTGKPVNSLLDEVLQPLDRDVFQRENRYYDGLKGGQAPVKTGAAQGSANKP
jgi:hypothetical protein